MGARFGVKRILVGMLFLVLVWAAHGRPPEAANATGGGTVEAEGWKPQFSDDFNRDMLNPDSIDLKRPYWQVINGKWRICFVWTPNGPAEVEIVDYH